MRKEYWYIGTIVVLFVGLAVVSAVSLLASQQNTVLQAQIDVLHQQMDELQNHEDEEEVASDLEKGVEGVQLYASAKAYNASRTRYVYFESTNPAVYKRGVFDVEYGWPYFSYNGDTIFDIISDAELQPYEEHTVSPLIVMVGEVGGTEFDASHLFTGETAIGLTYIGEWLDDTTLVEVSKMGDAGFGSVKYVAVNIDTQERTTLYRHLTSAGFDENVPTSMVVRGSIDGNYLYQECIGESCGDIRMYHGIGDYRAGEFGDAVADVEPEFIISTDAKLVIDIDQDTFRENRGTQMTISLGDETYLVDFQAGSYTQN